MMEAEMDGHLGYEKSERSDNDDYRNGYKSKTVKSSIGEVELEVPQDRKSTIEPQVVKKGQKDISDIHQKIISMYTIEAKDLFLSNPYLLTSKYNFFLLKLTKGGNSICISEHC